MGASCGQRVCHGFPALPLLRLQARDGSGRGNLLRGSTTGPHGSQTAQSITAELSAACTSVGTPVLVLDPLHVPGEFLGPLPICLCPLDCHPTPTTSLPQVSLLCWAGVGVASALSLPTGFIPPTGEHPLGVHVPAEAQAEVGPTMTEKAKMVCAPSPVPPCPQSLPRLGPQRWREVGHGGSASPPRLPLACQ